MEREQLRLVTHMYQKGPLPREKAVEFLRKEFSGEEDPEGKQTLHRLDRYGGLTKVLGDRGIHEEQGWLLLRTDITNPQGVTFRLVQEIPPASVRRA